MKDKTTSPRILLLPGDGVGPEVIQQLKKVIAALCDDHFQPQVEHGRIGGSAYEHCKQPLPPETLEQAQACQAILLGAVGAPQYDTLPRELRPETGLLGLRKELGLFANLRPIQCRPALASASTLKEEVIADLDLLIVRELIGGIYFSKPRAVEKDKHGKRFAYNTMFYHEDEIRRIAKVAFAAARQRSGRLCSVDKANVLEVSWFVERGSG